MDEVWEDSEKVTTLENLSLTASFTEQEIHDTVFSMNPNKASGPDDFSILFYQKFWNLIKCDILQMFTVFFNHQFDLSKLNKALICLIPEVVGIISIKDYRPISVLNCSFKFFTKVLATRFLPVLNRLIGINQHAFLKGRNIMDNVIAAHEILHSINQTKEPSLLLNLDFEKPFDTVDWNYLLSTF
jgi:Reverse transcriptase (RNA-dependent DNA polymerase)